MFSVFGALALVLAAIGLYSVIAYNVTQRTHEMGVRVALGAQARDVIRLIVSEGLRIVLPGVALGAVLALLAGKWIAPLLFQVSPKDPPVLVGVVDDTHRGGDDRELAAGAPSGSRGPERSVESGLVEPALDASSS